MNRAPVPSPEVVSLLERRAERLRHASPEEIAGEPPTWIAELPIGDEFYGIPLESLRGAARGCRVTPVPQSSPEVIGLFRFRGEMYTALSLPALLGRPDARRDPSVLLVVDCGDGQGVGLGCDDVPRLIGVPERVVGDVGPLAAAAARGPGA